MVSNSFVKNIVKLVFILNINSFKKCLTENLNIILC